MILAVNYVPGKMPDVYFPAAVTEKYDGVAGRFTYSRTIDQVLAMSRQNESIESVQHIKDWLLHKLPPQRELIGELYIPDTPFKDLSGIVRRYVCDTRIILMIYDYVVYEGFEGLTYEQRMAKCMQELGPHMTQPDRPVWFMPTKIVNNGGEIDECMAAVKAANPKAEGIVIRPCHHSDSVYKVGRSKGLIRWKPEPTIDLMIVGLVEAVDKHGVLMGMVGRLEAMYKGKKIGIGPGKLTHEERRILWANRHTALMSGDIAEIKYMEDDAYEALRQPTFQRWRPDKTVPDA